MYPPPPICCANLVFVKHSQSQGREGKQNVMAQRKTNKWDCCELLIVLVSIIMALNFFTACKAFIYSFI